MLLQSSQLARGRVISLHTSQAIATLGEPIINPNTLSVEAYYCQAATGQKQALLTKDIREAAPGKVLVDSVDEITAVDQLMRLQEIINLRFNLIGKRVRTTGKKHLGKVEEYIVDTLNFQITKLYVKQSVLKSFSLQSKVIDRSQIIEVSDHYVVVEEATTTEPKAVAEPTPAVD